MGCSAVTLGSILNGVILDTNNLELLLPQVQPSTVVKRETRVHECTSAEANKFKI